MPITLHLRDKELILEERMTLKKAMKTLELSAESHLAMRNGEMMQEDEILKEGDHVTIIPVISGG
jgi:sulfur carrier protein ThiS